MMQSLEDWLAIVVSQQVKVIMPILILQMEL